LDQLPSPRINQERLEFVRSPDRPGVIRLAPGSPPFERPRQPEPPPQPVTQAPPAPARRQVIEQPVIEMGPAPEPIIETYYVAPVYTGIIVMNPPEKKPKPKRQPAAAAAASVIPQPGEPDNPPLARQDS